VRAPHGNAAFPGSRYLPQGQPIWVVFFFGFWVGEIENPRVADAGVSGTMMGVVMCVGSGTRQLSPSRLLVSAHS
jgi:hypothetical protein